MYASMKVFAFLLVDRFLKVFTFLWFEIMRHKNRPQMNLKAGLLEAFKKYKQEFEFL